MPDVVKSKFNLWFLIETVTTISLLPVLIITGVIASAMSNTERLLSMISVAAVSILLFFYAQLPLLKTFTATWEGLILYDILSKRKTVIRYDEIAEVNNIRLRSMNFGTPVTLRYRKLEIVLNTGDSFFIYEEVIKNYPDLRNAIWFFKWEEDEE
jgi:hypothetical protein